MEERRGWFAWRFRGVERQAQRIFQEATAAWGRQDYEAALPLYEECLPMFRKLEHWEAVWFIRVQLGFAAQYLGEYSRARAHFEQAVSLARTKQQADYLDISLINLAGVVSLLGEIALAERLYREYLATHTQEQNPSHWASIHIGLAGIGKNMAAVRHHYEVALAIYRAEESPAGIMACLCGLGHGTEPGQEYGSQRLWLQECLELCGKHSPDSRQTRKTRSYALNNLGNIERFEGNFDRALELYRASLRLKADSQDEWGITYTLDGCAAIALEQGETAQAARLLGKASEIRERLRTPLEPSKQSEYAELLAELRKRLSAAEFASAWEEGKRRSLDRVLEEALGA